ncbi:glycosyltransferase family 2 protein [Pseudorhodobacter ferrugineus]|uniref:glycosyltransferase family 2 protein n=1 Tax=Pseudorhodobacter ferrugineus TaxID=77008 RepID=UPI0003B4595E|nr:glycosyltransferase family 2 protein [Pseudorhodobacter ferrugineus]
MIARILAGIKRRWHSFAAARAVRRGNVVLYGPARVDLAPDGVAVVCLVKDAAYFVRGFIEHHQALGLRHIVIVDNGSSDDTVAIAAGYDDVTVIANTLPAKRYEVLLRDIAARQVLRGGWVLFADADEMFEVPMGAPLGRLVGYLNAHGFTAMVTQMLDLFSPLPYGVGKGWSYAEVVAQADSYSLSSVASVPYHDRAQVGFSWFLDSNQGDVALKIGGVRREVFGEACFLSKHSLVRNAGGVLMTHPHCASGVRVADVTGVLRHYKLAGDYLARDRASVEAGTWDHSEDAKRLAAAKGGDNFVIKPAEAQGYAGPERLVDQGFLEASAAYRAFIT